MGSGSTKKHPHVDAADDVSDEPKESDDAASQWAQPGSEFVAPKRRWRSAIDEAANRANLSLFGRDQSEYNPIPEDKLRQSVSCNVYITSSKQYSLCGRKTMCTHKENSSQLPWKLVVDCILVNLCVDRLVY